MIRLFCGYDDRESIGFHVFVASVIARASRHVLINALDAKGLRKGSNAFTFSRFLVPSLCEFKGHAIFADASDMLMLDDLAELDGLFDQSKAVQVVMHKNYKTRHRVKYIGTSMQCPNMDYQRKNWASLMLINCEHGAWKELSRERIENMKPQDLLGFKWLADDLIGELPNKWNRLVDEGHPVDGASILHWTAGIPAFPHYADAPGADYWKSQRDCMLEVA